MPHALLLSPDDQAVSAITGVLEEMSVTCERPLDGVSAAQKLNSQTFDLVLVDCENLPAAKLIFDVCRRGKNGNNPVPIAIVDGRAGLPTAFRLGAELILTKPVAKDQARSTIRTAVSRVRKDAQTNESVPAEPASADVHSAVMPGAGMSEEHARAAAAASVSSQLTSFAEPAPSFVPTFVPAAAATATLSAPALTSEMHSAIDEIDATPISPKLNLQCGSSSASSLSDLSEPSSARAVSAKSMPARPMKPSDDPVLAELERTELEESELAKSQLKGSRPESSILESSGPGKAAPNQPAAKSGAPAVSSSRQASSRQGRQKRRGPLVALLMLVLAGGGFYALWTYQPGFRDFAQPQIDRVLALAGMALPPTPASNPAKPSTQSAPATSTPAPESPADPNQTQSKAADSATSSVTDSATGSVTASAATAAPVRPTATPGKAVMPPASAATAATAPVATKPESNQASDKLVNSKKDAAAATPSDAPLPGENSAIILSSKGAEKRLAHSVPPDGLRLVEGNATLATAAIKAVKQWRYRPYVRDGKAQAFQTVVIVDFQRP